MWLLETIVYACVTVYLISEGIGLIGDVMKDRAEDRRRELARQEREL